MGGVGGFLADLPTDIADFLDSLGVRFRRISGSAVLRQSVRARVLGIVVARCTQFQDENNVPFEGARSPHPFAKLRVHPNDPTIRTELDKLKSQLLELASSLIHHD